MKYKQLAEEREKELHSRMEEIEALKARIAQSESDFADAIGAQLDSEEAREILRMFAAKAANRQELVLLVRALSKLPA